MIGFRLETPISSLGFLNKGFSSEKPLFFGRGIISVFLEKYTNYRPKMLDNGVRLW